MTLGAAVLLLFASQIPPSPEPPSFGAGVEEVYLDVAVRKSGQPVAGLTAADFELAEEGSPRSLEVVEGANAPLHAILALDLSSSVQGKRLEALRAAASAFLAGLGEKDRATLLTFSHRVRLETRVGVTPAEARAALLRTQAGGGTALFDAVYAAVALADRRYGRPIVLVFSDGNDELSWLSEERLKVLVHESSGVVHAVAVTASPENARFSMRVDLDDRGRRAREAQGGKTDAERVFDAQSQASMQRAVGSAVPEVLTAIAAETGGEVWRAENDAALGRAFAGVLADLRSRYLLRFEPSGGNPGDWREVRIKLKNGRGEIHARKGFRRGPAR